MVCSFTLPPCSVYGYLLHVVQFFSPTLLCVWLFIAWCAVVLAHRVSCVVVYCVFSREIVPLSSIEHVQKKRRHDKEARLATVLVSDSYFSHACTLSQTTELYITRTHLTALCLGLPG